MRSLVQLLRMLIMGLVYAFRHRKATAKLRSLTEQQNTIHSVLDAFRRGDYETALQAAEGLRTEGSWTPEYCFFRGSMLTHLGQFDEAEKWLRENVAREKDNKRSALNYSTLGQLLVHQQRYDQAMDCFATSLRLWPNRGSTHRDIAEAWLRRGNRPSEALQSARLAVDKDRAVEGVSREVRDVNLGEDLATLAWAVAVASRERAEVDRLAAEAVSLVGSHPISSVAQVHYHSGQAYAALGDPGRSAYHFEEAARIDPQGVWGRAARAMETGVSR